MKARGDYSLLAGFPLVYCGGEVACAGGSSVITDTNSSTARPKSSVKELRPLLKRHKVPIRSKLDTETEIVLRVFWPKIRLVNKMTGIILKMLKVLPLTPAVLPAVLSPGLTKWNYKSLLITFKSNHLGNTSQVNKVEITTIVKVNRWTNDGYVQNEL